MEYLNYVHAINRMYRQSMILDRRLFFAKDVKNWRSDVLKLFHLLYGKRLSVNFFDFAFSICWNIWLACPFAFNRLLSIVND